MKKKIVVLAMMAALACGCGNRQETPAQTPATQAEETTLQNNEKKEADIEITEEMYVEWINKIYENPEQYLGQTVSLEGMFYEEEEDGEKHYYVYRQGPGCCDNDGEMCGFEFTYDGIMPEDNDWVKLIGEITEYEDEGIRYLSVKADSVRVKEERGSETVY